MLATRSMQTRSSKRRVPHEEDAANSSMPAKWARKTNATTPQTVVLPERPKLVITILSSKTPRRLMKPLSPSRAVSVPRFEKDYTKRFVPSEPMISEEIEERAVATMLLDLGAADTRR